jgi:protein tyrosine phosphatase (PTP) superfamily phosphohydrolase (DUF442 family)
MSIEDAYNFRRINERLTTSGLVTVAQLLDLQGDGYDAVINLLPDTHAHAVPGEARIVEESGLDYVYIPVDFDAPTHTDLDLLAEARPDGSVKSVLRQLMPIRCGLGHWAENIERCQRPRSKHGYLR